MVDFADDAVLRATVENAIRLHGFPAGAVFCQRYRGNRIELLPDFCSGIQVELGPTLALLERLEDRQLGKSLALVMFTSVASEQVNPDVPLAYHMLKAATASFVRYQAMALRNSNIRINAVVLGELLKYPFNSYTSFEQQKFVELARLSNIGRVCEVQDAVSLARTLLENPDLAVNGQLIHLDGGVTQLASEAVVRDRINRTPTYGAGD